MQAMGFVAARSLAIECLLARRIQHEARKDGESKNLLFTEAVSPTEVIAMLKASTGADYSSELHHQSRIIQTHIFRPRGRFRGWYIKLYFIEPEVVFISVHR